MIVKIVAEVRALYKEAYDKGCIYEDLQVMLHLDHIQFDDDIELLNSDLADYSYPCVLRVK